MLASILISITAFVLFVNFMPVMAHALESVPGMEIPVKIARAGCFNARWGDTGITENRPEFDGDDKSAAADMNLKTEDYINSMRDKFIWYLSRKYSGYVNEDTSYKVIRDGGRLLSVFFTTVINAGSSVEYNRCINLDRQSGKVLELKDLFVENSSYITVISEEIKRQMKVRNDSGKARYFIPGSMGAPEFVIDTGILQNILTQPSCIGGGKIDLYLLDIIMPDITGIELSKEIRKMRDKSEIIFLTVSSEYAVEAFGVRASGYLLKPVAEEDFNEIVSVCMERIFSYKEQSIMLKTNDGMRKIDINMLVMVESFNHTRILLFIDGTRVETPVALTEIFERLSCYKNFYMPHRAYIINMAHVTGIKKSSLLLAIGMEVPIAKGRQDKIKSAFSDYFFGSSKYRALISLICKTE